VGLRDNLCRFRGYVGIVEEGNFVIDHRRDRDIASEPNGAIRFAIR
jgi:hypothetical protein